MHIRQSGEGPHPFTCQASRGFSIQDTDQKDTTMDRPGAFLTLCLLVFSAVASSSVSGADVTRFRGARGSGVSAEMGLPVEWSSTKNIDWRVKLPGPGTSGPIVLGDRIYVTCYSGYGLKTNTGDLGDLNDLMRHLLCIDRKTGEIVWEQKFKPEFPESEYLAGNDSQHGYASSTPTTDGERLYVFFGKSGVYCLDLRGDQLWHASVGDGLHGWGSSNSPVLYKHLVIINASVESESVVALNKMTGQEVWRVGSINNSWCTPVLVNPSQGGTELAISDSKTVLGLVPETGEELWRVGGFDRYVCPSLIAHQGIVYAVRDGSAAIRAGGRGDVTESHVVWRTGADSLVPSPVFHEGHLYWVPGGVAHCVDASTGKTAFQQRLAPQPGTIYSSVLLADGKLYCASQRNGIFVLAAKPEFEQLAHNVFEDDGSRTNASPIAHDGQLILRTDRFLYCIGAAEAKNN